MLSISLSLVVPRIESEFRCLFNVSHGLITSQMLLLIDTYVMKNHQIPPSEHIITQTCHCGIANSFDVNQVGSVYLTLAGGLTWE